MKLRIGTRGSDLALTQARWVAAKLGEAGVETELVVVSTSGDRSSAPSFGAIGPQGVFVREIEQALVDGAVDIAVHSYKDLPTESPAGLVIAAAPPRRDPADWLFIARGGAEGQSPWGPWGPWGQSPWGQSPWGQSPWGQSPWGQSPWGQSPTRQNSGAPRALTPGAPRALTLLPAGARVGTASARRQAWLRHYRADTEAVPLRGNVPTRLKRLADGDYDAVLLAGAGVERLTEHSDVLADSLGKIERVRLEPHEFVPAPAQGALAVQCRAADRAVRESLLALDDGATRAAVDLERRVLALAEGGCDSAFGAYAAAAASGFVLQVMTERDGRVVRAEVRGKAEDGLEIDAMQALARQSRSAAP